MASISALSNSGAITLSIVIYRACSGIVPFSLRVPLQVTLEAQGQFVYLPSFKGGITHETAANV